MQNKDIDTIKHELDTSLEIFRDFFEEVEVLYKDLDAIRVTSRMMKDPTILTSRVSEIITGFEDSLRIYENGYLSNMRNIRRLLHDEELKNDSRINNLS